MNDALPIKVAAPGRTAGRRQPAPTRGFAILITITLLSFLVLLMLSITLLTRIGTQLSANGLQEAQARQNALVALSVAVGQLDKFAGPDQRVTAPADLARLNDGDPLTTPPTGFTAPSSTIGLVAPNVSGGTREWTGVFGWGTSTTLGAQEYTSSQSPVLLTWLVSGNETTTVTLSGNNGQVIAPAVKPAFQPNQVVAGLSATMSAVTPSLTIAATGGTKPAVLLVGPNTAGTTAVSTTLSGVTEQTSAVARYVVAPLVDLTAVGTALPGLAAGSTYRVGRMAYAVLDEGVKARYNLRDTNGTSTALTLQQTRLRFLPAQRNGMERMQGFTGYPINTLSASNVLAPSQVRFGDNSLSANTTASQTIWQGHFHDFTTYAYGLLADSMRGGLRYDLTAAFDQATITTANPLFSTVTATAGLKGKLILPDGTGSAAAGSTTTTEPGGPAVSPTQGPKWDTLASYYNLSALTATTAGTITLNGVVGASAGAVIMRGPTDASGNPQQPIAPVVVQTRLRFGIFMGMGASQGTPPYPYYISCDPVFVLANPYNFPIAVPAAGLDLQYVMNTNPPDASGISGPTAGSRTAFDWGIDANIRWGNGLGVVNGPGIHVDSEVSSGAYPNGHFESPFDMDLYPGLRNKPVLSDGTTLAHYGTLDSKHHLSGYFPILKNNAAFGYDTDPSVLGSVAFHISPAAATTFAPGEVKIFSLAYVAVNGPAPQPAPIANESYPQGGFNQNAVIGDLCAAIVTGPDTPGNVTPARILNLDPVFNPAYFLRDCGQPNVATTAGGEAGTAAVYPDHNAMLMVLYPAPSCTLELRVGGSAPGKNVIKSVLNLDLTGYPRGMSTLATTVGTAPEVNDSPAFPNGSPLVESVPNDGFRRNQATTWPMRVTDFYFTLAPPETVWLAHHRANGPTPYELDFFNTDNLGNRVSFRSYGDYNLRAGNMALSPVAPLSVPFIRPGSFQFIQDGATPAIYANTAGFPTVPPYVDMFDQVEGPDSGEPPVVATSEQFSDLTTMGLWGHSTGASMIAGTNTVKNVILFNSPSRVTVATEMPMASLAQLQHADATADDLFASVGYQPGNAIGNSWFSPYVARPTSLRKNIIVKSDPRPMVGNTPNLAPAGGVGVYDISYLLNAALWDRYFFSTLRQTSAVAGKPANNRLSFVAGYIPTATQLGINTSGAKPLTVPEPTNPNNPLPTPYAAARYLLVNGAFNINSTSVEAWRAVLSSLRAIGLNGVVSTSPTAPAGETPFPRSLPPPSFALNGTLSSALLSPSVYTATSSGIESPAFAGFRKLTDPQVDALAVRIVQEIRSRGPFLSLAQFVNRRLGAATDPASNAGLLQSALDATVNTTTTLPNAKETVDFSPNDNTIYPDFNPTKDSLNRSTGIPGWLTQADVLQALGPVLAARSDTFVVRAYGEVVDPLDANATSTTLGPAAASIQARAWCEAVVQRMPDYSDPTNSPAVAPTDPAFTFANKQFGRKFQVVAFRWLSPSDI